MNTDEVRRLLRPVLLGEEPGHLLAGWRPEDTRALVTLTSGVFARLVSARFAGPDDEGIEEFLTQVRDAYGLAEEIPVDLAAAFVRGVFGQRDALQRIPPDRVVDVLVLLTGVLVDEWGMSGDELDVLLTAAAHDNAR